MTDRAERRRRQRERHRAPLVEPCFDCECCALWSQSLELLRSHIGRHVAGELRSKPCHEDCLVCADVAWQEPAQ